MLLGSIATILGNGNVGNRVTNAGSSPAFVQRSVSLQKFTSYAVGQLK